MTTKRTKAPPPWFDFDDYAGPTRKLDTRGWAIMLWTRQHYRDELDSRRERAELGRGQPDTRPINSPIDPQAYWETYIRDVRPADYVRELKDIRPSGLGPPKFETLVDVTSAVSRSRSAARAIIEYEVGAFGRRLLLVDPEAADTALKAAFKSWIADIRRRRPLPIGRRGPRQANVEITESLIMTWQAYEVLAVLDLDFYADLFGEPKLTHLALRGLLELSGDTIDAGRYARTKAGEALACADILLSQVQTGAK